VALIIQIFFVLYSAHGHDLRHQKISYLLESSKKRERKAFILTKVQRTTFPTTKIRLVALDTEAVLLNIHERERSFPSLFESFERFLVLRAENCAKV
jgi:hypothetical protein